MEASTPVAALTVRAEALRGGTSFARAVYNAAVMRLPLAVALFAFASSAEDRTPVALEAETLDPVRLLAAATGACAPSLPAFMRTWCPAPELLKTAKGARFAHQAKVVAQREVGPGLLELTVEPVEYGKGLMLFLAPPQVSCDASSCIPGSREQLVVHLSGEAKPAAPIDTVTFTFAVKGFWRIRQWWGPRPVEVKVTVPGASAVEGVVLEHASVEGR